MILLFKISVVLIFIPLQYLGCFNNFTGMSWKKRLLIVAGFLPYFIAEAIFFHWISNHVYMDKKLAEDTANAYMGIFIAPYMVFILRMFFNSSYSFMSRHTFKKVGKEAIMERITGILYKTQSFFFFTAGCFIIIAVTIDVISNEPVIPVKESNIVLEKWLFTSDDPQELNRVANHLFPFTDTLQSDTLSLVFYDDNQKGFMLHKTDSIRIMYDYSVDELKLKKDKKEWTYQILSRSENEMTVKADTFQITLVKGDF